MNELRRDENEAFGALRQTPREGGVGHGRTGRRGEGDGNVALHTEAAGEVTLSFEEAMTGTVASLDLEEDRTCRTCKGSGSKTDTMCAFCKGAGRSVRRSGGVTITKICEACAGSGLEPASCCSSCKGAGRERHVESVRLRVPAGVADQALLRLPHGDSNARALVRVRVREHPYFSRLGRDVELRLPLSYAEAALGTAVSVPLWGEARVEVRVPPGVSHGTRLRVAGRGAPGDPPGDLYLVCHIAVPRRLSEEERSAIEALEKVSPSPRTGWPSTGN